MFFFHVHFLLRQFDKAKKEEIKGELFVVETQLFDFQIKTNDILFPEGKEFILNFIITGFSIHYLF